MLLDDITLARAESPADLLNLEESLAEPAANGALVTWAFRGQSQSYGTLVPSFQRIFGQKRSVAAAEIIEQDLIRTFRDHYATLKDRTPDMPAPHSIRDGYDLRCLSVMQHYGVPTRLLDWTSNFWTAVYFACAGDPSKEAELWMYDRNLFSRQWAPESALSSLRDEIKPNIYNPPEPSVLRVRGKEIFELDPKMTPRMREQFAHHTLSSDLFADHGPLLLAMKQAAAPGTGPFQRVPIAPGCKEKALRFLADQLNVTAGTIFPDVEGLGKFLHWHLESLVTTLL